MALIDPLLMELEMEGAATRRVLEAAPEAKLTWRPHPKSFSLGQLALHVASVPSALAQIISLDTMEAPQFQQAQPANKQEILTELGRSLAAARETVSKMDDARVTGIWTMTRDGKTILQAPRIALLRSLMLNHWYHHRGQLSVYLRLLDAPVPSVYGPSADENPFA